MGGFFGVVSKDDCANSLFYGTDYHCHLGTRRGGLALYDGTEFSRVIHDITNAQFKSKFEHDISDMKGRTGIGVISDYEDQPLIIGSHLGVYALATVSIVKNSQELAGQAFTARNAHFSEMSGDEINQTELISTLLNQGDTFEDGILNVQEKIDGSCSMLILTQKGIFAARDRYGRTPVILGEREDGIAVTMETSAFPNLGYSPVRELGPGEAVLLTPEGIENVLPARDVLNICSFLYIYYGYPASSYQGVNVEESRYRCGAALARRDNVEIDCVAGIPDSGTGHALGYSAESKIPVKRPFVKYTPTWPRSFMPQDQSVRDLVAKMKLIPIRELTQGARMLFCDDSIVRGTQLKNTFQTLYDYGAKEIHLRIACPPLLYGCRFLNFSRSRSEYDLAARQAVREIIGENDLDPGALEAYADGESDEYAEMEERIRRRLGITSLRYQLLDDMISAIGLPRKSLCTYCWTGP